MKEGCCFLLCVSLFIHSFEPLWEDEYIWKGSLKPCQSYNSSVSEKCTVFFNRLPLTGSRLHHPTFQKNDFKRPVINYTMQVIDYHYFRFKKQHF